MWRQPPPKTYWNPYERSVRRAPRRDYRPQHVVEWASGYGMPMAGSRSSNPTGRGQMYDLSFGNGH
jgi:hypothetical protein